MSRRVATITLNPAYDLVGFCPEIERGEVNLVRTTGLHAAGKGINVAKVLKDLGIDVTVGGFLGKDNQDGFQQLFSELGIANRFQVVQGRTRINVKLTEKDGEVTDLNFSGFEVTPSDWERFVNDSLTWLGQFDMVCVSGSLPSGVSPEAFTDWMTRLRSQCPCIIFDSSRDALVAGLKASPWLVKPNRRELEIWAGRKLPELKDVIDAAHALRESWVVERVETTIKRLPKEQRDVAKPRIERAYRQAADGGTLGPDVVIQIQGMGDLIACLLQTGGTTPDTRGHYNRQLTFVEAVLMPQ